ncbi:MAG: ATP-dependent DNA ligase, partial [Thaumarchaeota archaeon]|nr:ATP-dependent DNA ligase [Nitrososphaerota archaeon]
DTGEFLPFQELMHRRRKYNISKAVQDYPITVNLFDIMFVDGKSCLDMPYTERRKLLESIVSEDSFARVMPMVIVKSDDEVEDFLENAINSGCEGLMLKQLDSSYRAGARASNWLKLKREYRNELGDSLDLVVTGAFYGRGRRTGRYGALLLSAYDEDSDSYPSVCKVGTGFTDESLDQFYQILSDKIAIKKDPRVESGLEADVWFDPEVVIEIVASEITLSPIHKVALDKLRKGSGLALRFPKFTGKIRFEKTPENATSVNEIITMYNSQKKVVQSEKQF